jgi:hypothetical protein
MDWGGSASPERVSSESVPESADGGAARGRPSARAEEDGWVAPQEGGVAGAVSPVVPTPVMSARRCR